MEDRSTDVRELILERVFPELRYGGDPDIERYFDLRASGRMLDALSIYRSRLKPRYPDDAKRIILLKLYRTHSPAFPEFLHGLLSERAEEIMDRLKNNIDALIAPLYGVSMRDTYAVLKSVERVARLLPDDADAARHMAWTYADYAKLLEHRKPEMDRAAYLLGEFYDQASVDDDLPADFIASSLASEESRRYREKEEEKKNFFDLSRIEFDQSDINRIEISASLERDEDMVLAYCHKYWLRVEDPAFERIIWLYSRKYETRHYDVFKAIKTGRRRKYQDDDILTMVSTTIATRYNYTVQGDIYMQAAWRRLKANLYGQNTGRQLSRIPQEAAAANDDSTIQTPTISKRTTASKKKKAKAASPAKNRVEAKRSSGPRLIPTQHNVSSVKRDHLVKRNHVANIHVDELKAHGSISDRIKRLSGRAYDVYRVIFLSRVRSHIRATLLRHRAKTGGASREDTNKAENLIYEFIEANYINAYMDWASSQERSRVLSLGFDIVTLDEIIEACYRKISA
ncbi:MAG: hypothetical protein RBT62_06605 [Spirochaetia bacterium]|jgi:hypothetical protein|nr:hypothetical protein [Spirochaetia bacterium]